MQGLPGLAAERPRAERGQTDGDARLRDEREAEEITHLRRLFHHPAAEPCTEVFAQNADEEIAQAHGQQRHAESCGGRGKEGIEPEGHAGADEKE